MQITTVKKSGDCYLVNSSIFVPIDEANSDYQALKEWIKSGGVVEKEFTEAELKAQANAKILAQIAQLEKDQARPLRELNSSKSTDEQKVYAQAKIDSIDEQIDALRSQL